jgi:hypothetical protein
LAGKLGKKDKLTERTAISGCFSKTPGKKPDAGRLAPGCWENTGAEAASKPKAQEIVGGPRQSPACFTPAGMTARANRVLVCHWSWFTVLAIAGCRAEITCNYRPADSLRRAGLFTALPVPVSRGLLQSIAGGTIFPEF